jgi:octaprenyl-diphosphate synthase
MSAGSRQAVRVPEASCKSPSRPSVDVSGEKLQPRTTREDARELPEHYKYWILSYSETGKPGLRSQITALVNEAMSQEVRFLKEHQAYIERIDAGLKQLMMKHSTHPLHDPLTYSLQGGKRLRPLVVLLVNESIGTGTEDPIPATSAIELLHTVSLIHDDIIDKETVRREKPPYYQMFGVDSALLSADFVLGVILEVASLYEERSVGRELASAAIEMSAGEVMESRLAQEGSVVPWESYIKVLELKTASLFRASATVGAALSSKKSQASRMSEFGMKLGMAYQLRDDLADIQKPGELINSLEVTGEERVKKVAEAADEYGSSALAMLRGLPASPSLEKLGKLVVEYF